MIRKLVLATIAFAALTMAGYAQYNVTFSVILDATGTTGGYCRCATYNPGTGNFVVSGDQQGIFDISSVNGLPTGATYDMTGQNVAGLGFFGIGADTLGSVYGLNANTGALIRWANTTVLGATLATSLPFARNMCIQGTGVNTIVGMTGAANTGDIVILGTTDDVAYYLIDTVTGCAKSGHTFDAGLTQAWGVPDTWSQINKKMKVGGNWVSDNLADGGLWDKAATTYDVGAMWYDSVNNLLVGSSNRYDTLYAYDGTTAKVYGSQAFWADGYGNAGNTGGYADNLTVGGGTFYWGQRASTPYYHVGIANYGVTSVNDWTLY